MDDMTKLERGPMVGRMLEGDFEKDTITFHMPATYYLASGRYIIEPESDWLRRKEQLEALSARASAGEGGEWVMVPHEPTKSMVSEAVYNTNRKYDKVVVDATIVRQVWSTMMWARPVTAAPQPAQAGASGGSGRWLAEQDAKHLGTGYLVDGERVAPDRIEIIAAAPQPQEVPAQECRCIDDYVCDRCNEQTSRAVASAAYATPPAHGDGEGGDLAAELDRYADDLVDDSGDAPSFYQIATGLHDLSARLRKLTTRPTPEAQPPHVGEVIAEMRQEQDRAHLGRFGHRVRDWADRLSTHPTPEAQEASDWDRRETAARKLYSEHAGNHPTIHCNRFPSWDELTQNQRIEWRRKAALALPAQGEGSNG